MKYGIFLFAILLFSCEKNSTDERNNTRLQFIKAEGKIHQSFEYNDDNLLVKENWFSSCESNPSDEYMYTYIGTKPHTIKSVIRSLYSSTSAICDPASGIHSYVVIYYDNAGRISKIIRENGTYTTFYYNANGFIEKQVVNDGATNNYIYTYRRDAAGNMIEQTDAQGNKTQYEFDNKTNPYYRMNVHPNVITAFYNSPNNVVKIRSGNSSTAIIYEYNSSGLPVKMLEANGAVYEFVYR